MAKKPKEPTFDAIEHHWECEACKAINRGENPPDECRVCTHGYFENMADQLAERVRLGQLH